MAPKVLILTGDAAESLEVMYPYQRLQEEGYDAKIAAPTSKKLHFVVHDFEHGTMVSARAWPDNPAWMRAFISLLKEKAPVQKRGWRLASVPLHRNFLQRLKGYLHFSDRLQKTGPGASVFGERQLSLLRRSRARHGVAVG